MGNKTLELPISQDFDLKTIEFYRARQIGKHKEFDREIWGKDAPQAVGP